MSGNDALRLEVADFTDHDHWYWQLTDAAGKFLADHQVALDPAEAEYAAFLDLEAYLDQYAAPDKWPEDEVRLVEEVGAWIGQRVLGPVATRIVDYGTPVTVRVVVPPEASGLLYRPLELAHAHGQPLALHDVSLVFEVAGEVPPVRPRAVGDRLLLNDRHPFVIRRIGRYASFEELLTREDAASIAPDVSPGQLLERLCAIYPPEKEALGVVALEIEPE